VNAIYVGLIKVMLAQNFPSDLIMEETEIANGMGESGVSEFATYEDYLDSQITPVDLFYLEVSLFN
jgi:hypothetical protein